MVKLKNINIIIYLWRYVLILYRLSKFYISVKINSEHFGALKVGIFYKWKHGTGILGIYEQTTHVAPHY